MLPTETAFDVGLFGAFVASLGVGEPLEQRGVCPGAVGEEFAHHPTELRTGHLGHLFPPVLLECQQEGASQQGQGDMMMPATPDVYRADGPRSKAAGQPGTASLVGGAYLQELGGQSGAG